MHEILWCAECQAYWWVEKRWRGRGVIEILRLHRKYQGPCRPGMPVRK